MQQPQFTGTWITRDGYIKKQHFSDGKFGETDSSGKTTIGWYSVKGRKISYHNEKGTRVDADFFNGIIYEPGHTFYPEACAANCLERQIPLF